MILKVSHNLHASTLPLLLAAHHAETTLDAGLRREGAILKGLGVDGAAISFGGGAGGARADLVTPRATVTASASDGQETGFPRLRDRPFPCARPGRNARPGRLRGSPARGHARAKTGTYWLNNGLNGEAVLTSKALAGTMETASGRPLVFAFFLNNVPIANDNVNDATAAAGRILGKLCEVFYDDAEAAGSEDLRSTHDDLRAAGLSRGRRGRSSRYVLATRRCRPLPATATGYEVRSLAGRDACALGLRGGGWSAGRVQWRHSGHAHRKAQSWGETPRRSHWQIATKLRLGTEDRRFLAMIRVNQDELVETLIQLLEMS